MKLKTRFMMLVLALVVAGGCSAESTERYSDGDREAGDGGTDGSAGDDTMFDSVDTLGCKGMDILFVIDDSSSMMEEQTNLAENFPKFIQVIENYRTGQGENITYRVGVTTTSVTRQYKEEGPLGIPTNENTTKYGDVRDGALIGKGECGMSEPWIEGPALDVTGKFNCTANVGTYGVYMEMPFAALELALGTQSEPGGGNEGFYRKNENSLLVVVFLTDEDDCSVENGGFLAADGSTCSETKSEGLYEVEATKAFLDQVAGGEGRYVVVAIAGPGPQACRSAKFGDADPAKRLKRLTETVGANGVFGDICTGDLWLGLQEALNVMETSCSGLVPI